MYRVGQKRRAEEFDGTDSSNPPSGAVSKRPQTGASEGDASSSPNAESNNDLTRYINGSHAVRGDMEAAALVACDAAATWDASPNALQNLPRHTKVLGIIAAKERQAHWLQEQIQASFGLTKTDELEYYLNACRNGYLYNLPEDVLLKIFAECGGNSSVARSLNKYGKDHFHDPFVTRLAGDFSVQALPRLLSKFPKVEALDLSAVQGLSIQQSAALALSFVPTADESKIKTLSLRKLSLGGVDLTRFTDLIALDLSSAEGATAQSIADFLDAIPPDIKRQITKLSLAGLPLAQVNLAGFDRLTDLDLEASKVDAWSLKSVLDSIPFKEGIVRLNLSGLPIARVNLAKFTNLSDLNLGSAAGDDHDVARVLNSIDDQTKAQKIKKLNLSYLPLAQINLAKFLSLTALNLSAASNLNGRNLGAGKVRAVLASLTAQGSSQISELNLSWLNLSQTKNLAAFTGLIKLDLTGAEGLNGNAVKTILGSITPATRKRIEELKLSYLNLSRISLADFERLVFLELRAVRNSDVSVREGRAVPPEQRMSAQALATLIDVIPAQAAGRLVVEGLAA